ncbi:hypothetical protein [Corallococcus exiguus]|uniref:hypothetical protein n=1 Tax=Corallococcus exiguus TaxID=83462 RepID=UPI00265F2DE0|nr:hypothetical protein [Corallococcus exiguus]
MCAWWMALSVRLLGDSQFALRLPAILSSASGCAHRDGAPRRAAGDDLQAVVMSALAFSAGGGGTSDTSGFGRRKMKRLSPSTLE